ncbi:MAG: alanine--glyoxylate aminotransferase family protein [Rhodospirillaceae bacterium]|nr:alanine--glyoxylate aminotransferase family protein [Rhodospirillaceae bacterium]
MGNTISKVDPDGLLEFSVVFTDRSLNHMSQSFQAVMRDISDTLKDVYNAQSVAIVPGGGTYAMEAVARQLATDKKCMVIRNGWFSFRWSQIIDAGRITDHCRVLMARQVGEGDQAPFAPVPIDEAVAAIQADKPDLLFAPHVETASGIILPDDYLKALAEAQHAHGGLFVLDCIASGAIWIDMEETGVDVLISAPQKGWSASPAAGLVMMNEKARKVVGETASTSFACDLKKWTEIMEAYENGGHAYHATMPTDALVAFHASMQETKAIGFDVIHSRQQELGDKVRAALAKRQIKSVAAEGFGAPGVVVSYTQDGDIQSGKKFVGVGLQIAAGVPLQCDEPEGFRTFRLGLFGLDKLNDVDATVARLENALDEVI